MCTRSGLKVLATFDPDVIEGRPPEAEWRGVDAHLQPEGAAVALADGSVVARYDCQRVLRWDLATQQTAAYDGPSQGGGSVQRVEWLGPSTLLARSGWVCAEVQKLRVDPMTDPGRV